MQRLMIVKMSALLLLIALLVCASGCDPEKANSNNISGNGTNNQFQSGMSIGGAGATFLKINHPVAQIVGVILTVAGAYLMLDAAFGGEPLAVALTEQQRVALQTGGMLEIIDQSGNKRAVGRNYAPKVQQVFQGSVADSLGIQRGDILMSYDSRLLAFSSKEGNPMAEVVAQAANRGRVVLVVNRDGREILLSVLGGERLGVTYQLD
jgi:S1-C subfamily serine protease